MACRAPGTALLAILAMFFLIPCALRADDGEDGKSKLRFRPPGSRNATDDGRSRIRLGTTDNSAANDSAPTGSASQTGVKPTGSGVITAAYLQSQDGQVEERTGEENTGEENTGEENTGEENTGEENTGEEHPREERFVQGPRDSAGSHFAEDDFFRNNQNLQFTPPRRMLFTQDNGGMPPSQDATSQGFPGQDPQSQDPQGRLGQQQPGFQPQPSQQGVDPFVCKTQEQMGIQLLSQIDLNTDPGDVVPRNCPLFYEDFIPRNWKCVDFHWTASAICHKPLYFEDVALERYGHSHGIFTQPFVSGAHFFATIPALPYKMGVHHPTECVYPLGYYRPGSCAPKLLHPIPLSWRGLFYQGAASTGMVFLLP